MTDLEYLYPCLQKKPKLPKFIIVGAIVMLFLIVWAFANADEGLKASWYSVESLKREGTFKYSRGVMANGQLYSDFNYTVACRLYPLGSILRVKNIANGKTVVVRVTDRIGRRFAKSRLDLSKAAFMQIADLRQGLIPITVEVVK